MTRYKIITLSLTAVLLTACATSQDKAFVDSSDCKEMQAMLRMMPTSSSAIADKWERDSADRRFLSGTDEILNQPRSERRDSYLRNQYRKRCG